MNGKGLSGNVYGNVSIFKHTHTADSDQDYLRVEEQSVSEKQSHC